MNDFDYDVMQKKKLTYGAYHKKNGSKSKKCTLPSDYLTKKEIQKKYGGKTMTYNLSQPMEWKFFKKMPKDLQTEYLNGLANKYNASLNAIAGMFGITYSGLKSHVDLHEIPFESTSDGKMRIMKKQQRKEWEKFLGGNTKEKEIHNEEAAPAPVVEVETKPAEVEAEENPMRMSKVTLTFHGIIKPMDIANTLTYMFGNNSDGELKIEFLAGKKELDAADEFRW